MKDSPAVLMGALIGVALVLGGLGTCGSVFNARRITNNDIETHRRIERCSCKCGDIEVRGEKP